MLYYTGATGGGVWKTTNGGTTWEQVLKVGPRTGAADLSMDPTNPRILHAAMWNHGRKPWFIHSGGRDGGIYKSSDGGSSWKKLAGGLPEMVGKIGVDVSASNPNVLNVPMMKSVDGGKTWKKMSTPHGDHHDHWVHPKDNRIMANANDGGATISFDGGETWSSIMNQPTGQFYRVTTDNQSTFRIYGGQQDNSTVSIASQTWDGGIGVEDYFDVGGGESAHIAFDPDDPELIYATTINGTLTEYDHSTRLTRYIIPYPEMVYGKDSRDLKYRTNWNAPVAVSPHDASIVYFGAQLVLESRDRGLTWTEISADLRPVTIARNKGATAVR